MIGQWSITGDLFFLLFIVDFLRDLLAHPHVYIWRFHWLWAERSATIRIPQWWCDFTDVLFPLVGWLIEGCLLPLEQSAIDEKWSTKPAPLFSPKGHYWMWWPGNPWIPWLPIFNVNMAQLFLASGGAGCGLQLRTNGCFWFRHGVPQIMKALDLETYCNLLKAIDTHWNLLKPVETCWNLLKPVESYWYALKSIATYWNLFFSWGSTILRNQIVLSALYKWYPRLLWNNPGGLANSGVDSNKNSQPLLWSRISRRWLHIAPPPPHIARIQAKHHLRANANEQLSWLHFSPSFFFQNIS